MSIFDLIQKSLRGGANHETIKTHRRKRHLNLSEIQTLEDRLVLAPVLWAHDLGNQSKIYQVDVASGVSTVKNQLNFQLWDIAFDPAGNLFGIDSSSNLYQINIDTGSTYLKGKITNSEKINGLVFSTDGKLYGSGSYSLYEIDPATGVGTTFAQSFGTGIYSAGDLAFDNLGNLYLSTTYGDLAIINRQTGSASIIGNTGFKYILGMAYGPDGVLYGMSDYSGEVFSINTATGKGTRISNFANNGINSVGGTTFFGEASIRVSIQNASIVEGNSGNSLMEFNVVLSQPNTATVNVNYQTLSGTALEWSDYDGGNGSLTFSPGETVKKAKVYVRGDTDPESNETFTMTLSGVSGAVLDQAIATGTIINDDNRNVTPVPEPTARFTLSQYTVMENGVSGKITISLSHAYDKNFGVRFRTRQLTSQIRKGIAGENIDYVGQDLYVLFKPGQVTRNIYVKILDDNITEGDEELGLQLIHTATGKLLNSSKLKIIDTRKPRGWPYR